jgi:hypothetical protein
VIASALPVSVPALTASQLRGRILASARESYAGYAESNATFGLPPLAGLTGLTSLLDGVTKMRVWQATPTRWRVDVLSDAGERDTYQLASNLAGALSILGVVALPQQLAGRERTPVPEGVVNRTGCGQSGGCQPGPCARAPGPGCAA